MDKEHCLKLCLAIYRVTARFPKDEPLKNKIREKAAQVLAGLILSNPCPSPLIKKKLLKDAEILDNYFQIAQNQNWVDSRNFLVLRKEYNQIKLDVSGLNPDTSDPDVVGAVGVKPQRFRGLDIQPRHKKILEILQTREKAQVGEFKKIFPEITKRTLRRDFEFLSRQGLIKRKGDNNNTFYNLC